MLCCLQTETIRALLDIYAPSGMRLLSCECLGLAESNGPMNQYKGNTPTGIYDAKLAGPHSNTYSYGPYKYVSTTPQSGLHMMRDVLEYGFMEEILLLHLVQVCRDIHCVLHTAVSVFRIVINLQSKMFWQVKVRKAECWKSQRETDWRGKRAMKQHKGVFLLAAGAAVVLAAILLFGRHGPHKTRR